jgi:hypothetical protein
MPVKSLPSNPSLKHLKCQTNDLLARVQLWPAKRLLMVLETSTSRFVE